MDGVGARLGGGVEDLVEDQVGLGRVWPPRANASSASLTKSASASGSAYTATLGPASRSPDHRTAISPRLAMRTLLMPGDVFAEGGHWFSWAAAAMCGALS